MTVKIKKIKYLIPPRDIFNDALDVFVSLEDDYCTDDFCSFVEVTTPQFLSTIMEKEKSAFLSWLIYKIFLVFAGKPYAHPNPESAAPTVRMKKFYKVSRRTPFPFSILNY